MSLPLLVPLFAVCVCHTQARNLRLGIKLCNVRCMERSSCESFAYKASTLTCYLLPRTTEQQMEKGCMTFPKGKHIGHSFTGVCSLQTCPTSTRCLENRRGRAVCVHDYGDISPEVKAVTHSPDQPVNILKRQCNRDEHCVKKNFVCIWRECQCGIGFSFNPADNTCVKGCKVYGPRLTLYKRYAIKRPFTRRYKKQKSPSVHDCFRKCYKEATFTCVSFQYWNKKHICESLAFRWFDVPPEQRVKEVDAHIGTRDCA